MMSANLSREAKWVEELIDTERGLRAALDGVTDALVRCTPRYECRLSDQQYDEVLRDYLRENLEIRVLDLADELDEIGQRIAEDYCEL